jgi:HEAT repeat protein
MSINIAPLVEQLSGELSENAFKASDALGRIGSGEVVTAMIELLDHPNPESRILSARTLGLVKNNNDALRPLLDAVKKKENSSIAGDLMMALERFDVSDIYVELFRLYLFGSYKVSMIAKELLDFKEFDISPRTLKKAQKHWHHYSNNIKRDELYALREKEVEEMINDLREFLNQ